MAVVVSRVSQRRLTNPPVGVILETVADHGKTHHVAEGVGNDGWKDGAWRQLLSTVSGSHLCGCRGRLQSSRTRSCSRVGALVVSNDREESLTGTHGRHLGCTSSRALVAVRLVRVVDMGYCQHVGA